MAGTGANAKSVPEIPDKLYFRIGEVSKLLAVPAYVLRFWETEFPSIAPKKSGAGQRLYRRKDVQALLEIKQLLYDKRYTIEGARRALHNRGKAGSRRAPAQGDLFPPSAAALDSLRKELASILEILK